MDKQMCQLMFTSTYFFQAENDKLTGKKKSRGLKQNLKKNGQQVSF